MKRILLFSAAVLVAASSFTSCKKSYVCDCTTIPDIEYGKTKSSGIVYTANSLNCSAYSYSDATCKYTTK